MEVELAALPVGEKVAQGQGDGAEGDLVPGDLVFGEQRDLQRFDARRKVQIEQAGHVDGMHLADVRDTDERIQRAEFDPCAGFFKRFARRGFGHRLVLFHEAGG